MRPNAEGVYELATSQDLIDFREAVNASSNDINAKLTADIDLGGGSWIPIANGNLRYIGKFDGGGYTVNYIISGDQNIAGLFGRIGGSGIVSNLTVSCDINVSATGGVDAGGVAGENDGSITNCTVSCDINVSATGSVKAGGVAGENYGSITNCANSGRVTGSTTDTYNHVGGVAGGNRGSITSCANSGGVTGSAARSHNYAGGIAGICEGGGNISNCVNAGLVSAAASSSNYSGGIAGKIDGDSGDSNNITNCANRGSVTADGGNNNYSGGVAGESTYGWYRNKIEHCANSGRVTSGITGRSNYSGGIVGHNNGCDINNCGWLVSGDINAGLNAVGSDSDSSSSYVVSLNAAQMDRVVTTVLPASRDITVSLNDTADAFASHPGTAADMSAYFSVTSTSISPDIASIANSWPYRLRGNAEGRATLTASAAIKATSFADLNNLAPIATPLSADLSCAVTVVQPIAVTGVTLSSTELNLTAGSSAQLTATVQPTNATNKAVSWSSDNTAVATVDASGLVTTSAAGTATITVTTEEGAFTAACAVTVTEPPTSVDVKVTSVALSESSLTLDAGGTRRLTATVLPEQAANKAVSWSSDNTAVATVDASGLVTAVTAGTATITVTTADGGKTASCAVTVNGAPTPTPTPSGGSSGGCAAGIGATALLALLPLALRRRKK